MICLFALAAIAVLGKSISGLHVVSSHLDGSTVSRPSQVATLQSQATTHAADLSQFSSATLELQMFALASALFIVGFGIYHIRRSRQKTAEIERQTCAVQRFEKQSKALRSVLKKRNSIQSILTEDWVKLFEGNAQIQTYMSTDLFTVRPQMAVDDAEKLLKDHGFRRAMVTDQEGRMKGVVSRKDLASKIGRTVADVMTDKPKTADPKMSLRVALSILLQQRISCLPVVEDDYLVGLLSTSDLMMVLQCILVIIGEQFETAASNEAATKHENESLSCAAAASQFAQPFAETPALGQPARG